MERRPSDASGPAWFMAAVQAQDEAQAQDAVGAKDGSAEPDDRPPLDVIISVSLDELDGMTGDMLV